MTKTDLANAVSEQIGCTKAEASKHLNAVLDIITAKLRSSEDVRLTGFGTFECRYRAGRKGTNPNTGAKIDIPASYYVAFKPGAELKRATS